MIDNEGRLTVIDENNNKIDVFVLFIFEREELNKKYVAYTLDHDIEGKEDINILISEIDPETNQIKSINEEEMPMVKELYEEAKKTILED